MNAVNGPFVCAATHPSCMFVPRLRESHYSEMGIKFRRYITMVESTIRRNYVRFEVKRYNDITVANDSLHSPIVAFHVKVKTLQMAIVLFGDKFNGFTSTVK